MNTICLIKRLHEHRRWVNHNIIQAANQLSTSQLQQQFPMGQGSIWKSMTHLYGAEFVWLEALLGNSAPLTPGDVKGKLPGNQEAEDAIPSLNELTQCWKQLEARWVNCLNSLDETKLEESITKANSVTGVEKVTKCSDILLHVCTHAQYTTAQVVNMLRHVGVRELPDTMHLTLSGLSTKVVLSGYVIAPASDVEKIQDALPEHIRLTRSEPGCLVFDVQQCDSDSQRFDVFEEFVDDEAFDYHQARGKVSAWGAVSSNIKRHYQQTRDH